MPDAVLPPLPLGEDWGEGSRAAQAGPVLEQAAAGQAGASASPRPSPLPQEEGNDRAALHAFGRRVVSGAGGVFHFPIRHHSPACALHLARALDEVRPRSIVIEMPADFAPVLPLILDPATRPPVAVVAVADGAKGDDTPGGPAVTGYWPLSATAPEWAALQAASRLGARVVLADLPASRRLDPPHAGQPRQAPPEGTPAATEDQPGNGQGGIDPGAAPGASPNPAGPGAQAGPGDGFGPAPAMLTDERPLAYSDYARGLVARLGARDFNEAWDRLFESRAAETDWRGFFADVAAHCALSRRTALPEDMIADGTFGREAHMRAAIATAIAEGGPVAVVTGGFHTPALLDPDGLPNEPGRVGTAPMGAAPVDAVPIRPYLVRYSHASLDRLNGYASGMPSPRWYERLHAAVAVRRARPVRGRGAWRSFSRLAARLRRDHLGPGAPPARPWSRRSARRAAWRSCAACPAPAGPSCWTPPAPAS